MSDNALRNSCEDALIFFNTVINFCLNCVSVMLPPVIKYTSLWQIVKGVM